MHKMFNIILNLIFPPKCTFCESLLDEDSELRICEACYKKIPFNNQLIMRTLESSNASECNGTVCACRYLGIVQESLIRFKFHNKPGYYRTYAALIYDKLTKVLDTKKIDIIMSVPLHRQKQISRGYNQSYLISKQLSKKMNIPECSFLIKRTKHTDAQSLLDKEDRRENVKGAFSIADPKALKSKRILLIDDILTTGCTIDECARTLKRAGARFVIAAVVASGRGE